MLHKTLLQNPVAKNNKHLLLLQQLRARLWYSPGLTYPLLFGGRLAMGWGLIFLEFYLAGATPLCLPGLILLVSHILPAASCKHVLS